MPGRGPGQTGVSGRGHGGRLAVGAAAVPNRDHQRPRHLRQPVPHLRCLRAPLNGQLSPRPGAAVKCPVGSPSGRGQIGVAFASRDHGWRAHDRRADSNTDCNLVDHQSVHKIITHDHPLTVTTVDHREPFGLTYGLGDQDRETGNHSGSQIAQPTPYVYGTQTTVWWRKELSQTHVADRKPEPAASGGLRRQSLEYGHTVPRGPRPRSRIPSSFPSAHPRP